MGEDGKTDSVGSSPDGDNEMTVERMQRRYEILMRDLIGQSVVIEHMWKQIHGLIKENERMKQEIAGDRSGKIWVSPN